MYLTWSFALLLAALSVSAKMTSSAEQFGLTKSEPLDLKKWTYYGGGKIAPSEDGLKISILKEGDYPTIVSKFTMKEGKFSADIKTANGKGIITACILMSDAKDEIDWEWISGQPNQVQTNLYSKGKTGEGENYGSAGYHNIVENTQTTFHNYKIVWSPKLIEWSVDGQTIRKLTLDQWPGKIDTPMKIKMGLWAGGDKSNPKGTIQWAGGLTDFSKAPFEMTIKNIKVDSDALSPHNNDASASTDINSTATAEPRGSNGTSVQPSSTAVFSRTMVIPSARNTSLTTVERKTNDLVPTSYPNDKNKSGASRSTIMNTWGFLVSLLGAALFI